MLPAEQQPSPATTHFVLPPADSTDAVTYGNSLVSAPASDGLTPHVTQQQAIAKGGSMDGIAPQAALRIISYDPAGFGPVEPGLTDDLTVSSRLAWLLIYPGTPPILRGPPMSPTHYQQLVASATCDSILVFDANTGHEIDNEQECSVR